MLQNISKLSQDAECMLSNKTSQKSKIPNVHWLNNFLCLCFANVDAFVVVGFVVFVVVVVVVVAATVSENLSSGATDYVAAFRRDDRTLFLLLRATRRGHRPARVKASILILCFLFWGFQNLKYTEMNSVQIETWGDTNMYLGTWGLDTDPLSLSLTHTNNIVLSCLCLHILILIFFVSL